MANAHNQTVGRMSPRQKMINLMYIVLTAMLALNVSSDVLNGFTQVEDGLTRSNRTVSDRNKAIYSQLEAFNEQNPEKGGIWLSKATDVRKRTKELYTFIDSLKLAIVKTADGENKHLCYAKAVHIGKGCWFGAGVTVCPGVTIGDNCVIGAGSVVTRDIPPNSLAVGVPCRVIRELSEKDSLKNHPDILADNQII